MASKMRVLWFGLPLAWSMLGCGPQLGAFLYMFGNPTEEVKAKCKLGEGRLLILVDDDQELLDSPRTREYLVLALTRELELHKVNTQVIENQKLDRLRQRDPKFDERGAREIGRELGAEKVLWLQVESYQASTDLEQLERRPEFSVTVKVVNALAEKREDVRVWPEGPDGERVGVTESPHTAKDAKTADALARILATSLAEAVAELFYDHVIDKDTVERDSRRASE
jgi:hypothetical protein